MKLTAAQVKRFYGMWFPLLRYVNSKMELLDGDFLDHIFTPADACVLRDALWADSQLLESFIGENPVGLPAADLEVLKSWRTRVTGTFLVIKHLKKHSIFCSNERAASGDSKVYAVVGMSDPLDEMFYELPCMVKAVLIPFEGVITFDSLLNCYSISFGRNIKASLNSDYQAAKKQGQIIERLEQPLLALAQS